MEAPNWATAGGIEDVTIQLEERCRVALRSQRLGRPGRPGGNQWSTWLLETSHVFTGSFFYTKLESFPSKIRVSYIYIYIYNIHHCNTRNMSSGCTSNGKAYVFTAFTRDFRHFQHLGFRWTSSKTREAEPGDRTFRVSGGLDPRKLEFMWVKQCHVDHPPKKSPFQ
jgi:hypothetical protein